MKRYRYVGKGRDDESGFIYIGARYYCPWLARWLAVDPLESKYAPESPYNYCYNNPIRFIDPSGMGVGDNEAKIEPTVPVRMDVTSVYGPTGELISRTSTTFSIPEKDQASYTGFRGLHTVDVFMPLKATVNDGTLQNIAVSPTVSENFYSIQSEEGSSFATRMWGLLSAIGGTLEMMGGATLAVAGSETGVAIIAGGAIMAHGADVASAGLNELMTGKKTSTFTAQGISSGLQTAGVSQQKAEQVAAYTDAGIGILATAGMSGFTNLSKSGTLVKQTPKKVDYIFANRNDAMNWGRQQLGHNTERMYEAGKWIGWNSSKGKVYWGHGDWGKGIGSSTFPHLNYNIEGIKGHLFLQDKIVNRGMWDEFKSFFGL